MLPLAHLARCSVTLIAFALALASANAERAPSFIGDILPILSKAGCNSTGCHSKPEGQNNFKLSVFSYDPRSDYEEIVSDDGARRIFPAAPEHSLLLRKSTAELPHEGGQRILKGSPEHSALIRWIRDGMPYQLDDEATLTALHIEPSAHVAASGETGQFRAEAQFSDGSSREVTHLTDFSTESSGFVAVAEDGAFQMGVEHGEGTVVARYMGEVGVAKLSIPPAIVYPDAEYAAFRLNNFIDDHAADRWRGLGLLPSPPCGDSEFLRRASLSLIGKLPGAEQAREFLADTSPDKRADLVDRLLLDPNWPDHWAIKWIDLLRPNPDRVGIKSVYVLDEWIREQFRQNKPFDQFAAEVLTASGSTHRHGPAVVFRDRREPENLTTSMSQIFLGVRLESARCHHHPNERWSQDDFFQFAAFSAN